MNHSGDAAEQIMRITFDGMEHVLRIGGAGAKNIAALIMAAMKSDGRSGEGYKLKLKGKERLTNMLKSGKELKIFSMKSSDLEQFSKEAKRYGVVYCALKEKNAKPDSIVDVMAKAEDAGKISRIMERLQFATVDRATIESKMVEHDREVPDKDDTDKLLDMLIDQDGKAITDTPEKSAEDAVNPTKAGAEEQNAQSVSRSKTLSMSDDYTNPMTNSEQKPKKPESVEKFLRERTAAKKQEEKKPERQPELNPKPKSQQTPNQHQQPQNRGKKKSKKKER